MKTYKELVVWQKSFELAKEVYRLTSRFPKSEIYNLTSQMRRSVVSVPSNIAEGFCRGSRKEYAQFVNIAFASGAELETQILLAKTFNYLNESEWWKADILLEEIMKMLNILLRKLRYCA